MDFVLNLLTLGITVGSMYALFAVSFGLIFNVTHIYHFAHGAVISAAGYLVFLFVTKMGWPLWLGALAAIVLAAAFGAGIEIAIYRPLRRNGAPHVALFLASVGILTITEGLIGATFGPGVVTYDFLPLERVHVGLLDVTTANIAMLAAWPLIALAVVYLLRTPSGRFMRAVADTPAVATNAGIDLDKTYLVSFVLGSGLAVPATIMFAWYQGLTPLTGLSTILISSAAVIIGGRGNGVLPGAIAALCLGLIQAMAIMLLPSNWQNAVVFAILLLVIVFRPRGVFGRTVRW